MMRRSASPLHRVLNLRALIVIRIVTLVLKYESRYRFFQTKPNISLRSFCVILFLRYNLSSLSYTRFITPKTLVKVLWYRVTGFFFNVVCCQVSTNNVHSYQLSCGLDYIALCHVIAYVCFFICSSLFI